MRERKAEEDETFTIDVGEEIYLKHREEPVSVNTTFELRKASIDRETPVEDVMHMATSHALATFDVVREHRYILSDERHNRFIFMTDEIQAVSILAPDEQTVLTAMEA